MKDELEKIKKLREETLVSFALCKEALEKNNWDLEKAKDYLRQKGALKLEAKETRQSLNGTIDAYVHQGKIGVLVELRCETDFVAQNEEFKKLAHEIALQIASMMPKYIKIEDISQEEKEKMIEILKQSDKELATKPAEIQQKILDGKLRKIFEEIVLLEQPWIKNQDIKIKNLIEDAVLKFGEKIEISRFCLFKI